MITIIAMIEDTIKSDAFDDLEVVLTSELPPLMPG